MNYNSTIVIVILITFLITFFFFIFIKKNVLALSKRESKFVTIAFEHFYFPLHLFLQPSWISTGTFHLLIITDLCKASNMYYTGWPEKKLVKVNSYNSKNTKRRTINKKSHERIQLQVLFDIHVTAVLYIFHSLTSFF